MENHKKSTTISIQNSTRNALATSQLCCGTLFLFCVAATAASWQQNWPPLTLRCQFKSRIGKSQMQTQTLTKILLVDVASNYTKGGDHLEKTLFMTFVYGCLWQQQQLQQDTAATRITAQQTNIKMKNQR